MNPHPSRKKAQKNGFPVSYRWLAAGTLAMYTAIGVSTVNVALAQTAPAPAPAPTPATTADAIPPLRYDIPAGLMGTALDAYQERSGVHVALPLAGIRNLHSPGVSGFFTPQAAIEQILKDTGLVYKFTGQKEITVEPDKVLASVDVNARYTAVSTSMPKYTESLTDTPQSITVVPQKVLEEQNVSTLRDALRNVAGISLAAGEGGSQGDNLTIRGFTARNDLFIDGMRDFGSYYRDPFNLEEVEVLQGPSSVTFGRGSTGGVVNQATKAPMLNQFVSGTLNLGTDETRRMTADINIPLPKLGTGTAFRLNMMGDEGNMAGRHQAESRRDGFAPSLAFGIGTPTRVTLSYVHQNADDIPDYGIPWLFNQPAPVNRNNFYGFKDANYLRTYVDIGTIKAEHDINSHLTLRNQVRYANYVRHAQITEPQLVAPVTLATPLSAIQINRNQISADSTESDLDEQLDLTARFDTGAIHHTFMAGAEAGRETSDPTRHQFTNVPTTSLLSPDEDQPFTGYTVNTSSVVNTTSNSASAYFLETTKVGKWNFTGGWRWDRFNTHYTQNIAPATAFNRLDTMPTWRAAIVYKPVQAGSLYVSAGTSFNPSAESLSLSAANANLAPESNRTMEAGTKWDFPHANKLSLRAAVFHTIKMNAREPDPNNPLLNVLAGNQRVNGVQFEASGRVTRNWELLTSYAYLDGIVSSSQYYPAAVGASLANVPHNTFNVWNTFSLPRHFGAGLGTNYVSSRTASATVPLDPTTGLVKQVPGYWVFNAMLEHPLSEHVTIQANANNIANRYYYDELHPAHIVLGPGRSLLVGLKFKF